MSSELSPHVEHWIHQAILRGLYPSREAVIAAGVERLMDETGDEALSSADREAVRQAMADLEQAPAVTWDPEEFMRRYLQRLETRQASAG